MKYTALFSLVFLLHATGGAATFYVPDDYPTIQDAIDGAVNGDTVMVRPGTYLENIDFKNKAILVLSELGPDLTVIDGGAPVNPQEGSVVTFKSGETSLSILEGFTLTNGTGISKDAWWTGWVYGGGIYCIDSSPTLRNNIIRVIHCALSFLPRILDPDR